ncbi:MAG: VIT family protein [[Lactobacillus] timonensis]|jgi:VIT1/CCC1 family predicted Fe2+/Mn2+ transporter|nr:VIT family protein [[Lactobacillus] timonensis]
MAKRKMSLAQKINVLRAGVMGANDGILSVAGIVVGVAAATSNSFSILISGLSGSLAGTISMCMGEYVSVSTQKDSEKMAIIAEKQHLEDDLDGVRQDMVNRYLAQEIDPQLANKAADELLGDDALDNVVQEKYGFNPKEFTSPYEAAIASFIAFPTGSILPMLAVTLSPVKMRIVATIVAVLIALAITGYVAAVLGDSNRVKSAIRNVVSGMLTMGVTFLIGQLFAR